MIFEHYVAIYSSMVNVIMIVSYIITRNKDKKCEYAYKNKESINFVRKDFGLHVRHVFELNETDHGHMYIYIVDRNSVSIVTNGSEFLYKNKDMVKYKYAKKLLKYLTDNLNNWKL